MDHSKFGCVGRNNIEVTMNVNEEKDFSKSYNKETWLNLLQYLKPFKKNFIVLGCFMIVLASIDAAIPVFTAFAVDHFIGGETLKNFHWFVIAYVTAIGILSLVVFLFIREAGKIESGVTYELRKRALKSYRNYHFPTLIRRLSVG